MATKSFTNDVTFEPKDVDNLIGLKRDEV